MVKIRLRRVGAKKQPHYRIVVQDSRSPRDGKFIETIGNYNPRTEPPTIEIDVERALHWLSVGGQPSEAVRRMFDKLGILSQAAVAQAAKPAGQLPALPSFKPVELEEEAVPEEDEEFEVDLLEVEESEEEEEWESDGEAVEEADDFEEEDDWDGEVEDADDDEEEEEEEEEDRPLDDE